MSDARVESVRGGGIGCYRGSQPHPNSSQSPTRRWLAFQDFELGRTPATFISEGAGNGKRGRMEPEAFPGPCPGWDGQDL